MIVDFLFELMIEFLDIILNMLDIFPDLPMEMINSINYLIDIIFQAINLVSVFIDLNFVKKLIPFVILIIFSKQTYFIVMWVVKKIPVSIE